MGFHPQQPEPHQLDETSSKESIEPKQAKAGTGVVSGKRRSGAGKSQAGGAKTVKQVQRQIDINISRKGANESSSTEAGIFNKHFKRQMQSKAPLNIRTKKQMSTEAIQSGIVHHAGSVGGNTTTTMTQSTKNHNSTMAHVKQMILQKIAVDANEASQST